MMTTCLEHKSNLVSALEKTIARERIGITTMYQARDDAENPHSVLEQFNEATKALEGDYITQEHLELPHRSRYYRS